MKNLDGTDYRENLPIKQQNPIKYNIEWYGCAITSQAMVANYLSGHTTEYYIDQEDVNVTVAESKSYSNVKFTNGFPNIACVSCLSVRLTDRQVIINQIAPLIVNNHVAILGGYKATDSNKGHFVVVNGYSYRKDVYQYGTVMSYTELIITDPGTANRTNLQLYLNDFQVVSRIHVYRAN